MTTYLRKDAGKGAQEIAQDKENSARDLVMYKEGDLERSEAALDASGGVLSVEQRQVIRHIVALELAKKVLFHAEINNENVRVEILVKKKEDDLERRLRPSKA